MILLWVTAVTLFATANGAVTNVPVVLWHGMGM